MKKLLVALCALAVAATFASAGVAVNWTTQNWGEYHGGSGDGSGTAIAANNSVLWQLIFAGADGVANTVQQGQPVPADPSNHYLATGSDDSIVAERVIPQGGGTAADGTVWDAWLSRQPGELPVYSTLTWTQGEGSVYQRVFEFATPINGTYYFETQPLTLNTAWAGEGAPSQDFFVDPADGGMVPNRQVYIIPEPATMGVLGLGALAMVLRRKFRK